MLLNHSQKVLQLNRLLAGCMLALALWDAAMMSGAVYGVTLTQWAWPVMALRVLSALALVGLAQFLAWSMPRISGSAKMTATLPNTPAASPEDEAVQSMQPLLTMLLLGSYVATAMYVLSAGTYPAFALLAVPVFSAAFLGRVRAVWGLVGLVALQGLLMSLAGSFQPMPLGVVLGWANNSVLAGEHAQALGMALGGGFLPAVLLWGLMGHRVTQLIQSSSSQVSRLQSMATTDPLTGLINRRLFNLQLQGEWSRARRHQSPLCLALFDVDNFKQINDVYGHPVGDRILKEIAALVAHNLRDSDTPARFGGEEFAFILPETRQMEAAELMERVRVLIERHVFCLPDNPQTVTVSIGVAQFDPKAHTRPDDLVGQADAALYEAKHQGKNRVIYGVLPVPKVAYRSQRGMGVSY